MRIAHVTATFPPYYSGTGLVCYYNALELAKRGHQVTVFTADYPPGNHDYSTDFSVKRLPVFFRLGNAPLIPELLQLDGFDIIHLHHPFIFGAEMVWAISKLRKIPYILTHHNDLIGKGSRRYLFKSYSAISTRLLVSGASKFAVVSMEHAKNCSLASQYKSRWHDVVEVPNGVDIKLFRPGLDGINLRTRHGIPNKTDVILFVGALDRAHHFKGTDLLIKAFASLNTQQASLVIIGDGELVQGLKALSKKLNVASKVFFLGAISNQKLPQYYAMADILVLPSLPPESFGMVLIEAMACGIPVIASNLPGVRTVVNHGKNGFVIQPGDICELAQRIQELLDDPQKRRIMGQLGRAKVEQQYAWPIVVDKLEKLYEEVLDSRMKDRVLNPTTGKFRNS